MSQNVDRRKMLVEPKTVNDSVDEESTESSPNINRRNYLKGAGPAILGLAGFAQLGAAGGDDTVTYPAVLKGDKVIEYNTVPKEWHNHYEHVHQINNQLTKDFIDEPGIRSVGIIRGNSKYGGKRSLQIRMEVDDEKFSGKIPDAVEGIPIKQIEPRFGGFGSCSFRQEFNDVPGGATVEPDSGDCPPWGSFGCGVTFNGSRYMLTAHHTFGSSLGPCESIAGETVWHHGDQFGEVETGEDDEDWALIDETTGHSIDGSIYDTLVGDRVNVAGHASKAEVSNQISNGEIVHGTGVTTGTTTGPVTAAGVTASWECVDFNGQGIEVDLDFGDGDSGGPIYDIDNGDAAMITISCVQWGNHVDDISCCSSTSEVWDRAQGTAFYHMNNSVGLKTI